MMRVRFEIEKRPWYAFWKSDPEDTNDLSTVVNYLPSKAVEVISHSEFIVKEDSKLDWHDIKSHSKVGVVRTKHQWEFLMDKLEQDMFHFDQGYVIMGVYRKDLDLLSDIFANYKGFLYAADPFVKGFPKVEKISTCEFTPSGIPDQCTIKRLTINPKTGTILSITPGISECTMADIRSMGDFRSEMLSMARGFGSIIDMYVEPGSRLANDCLIFNVTGEFTDGTMHKCTWFSVEK